MSIRVSAVLALALALVTSASPLDPRLDCIDPVAPCCGYDFFTKTGRLRWHSLGFTTDPSQAVTTGGGIRQDISRTKYPGCLLGNWQQLLAMVDEGNHTHDSEKLYQDSPDRGDPSRQRLLSISVEHLPLQYLFGRLKLSWVQRQYAGSFSRNAPTPHNRAWVVIIRENNGGGAPKLGRQRILDIFGLSLMFADGEATACGVLAVVGSLERETPTPTSVTKASFHERLAKVAFTHCGVVNRGEPEALAGYRWTVGRL
ncbi:hypothetical protein OG21DRAFT_1522706 [Imleria badia]|nr:hypothetical protein OG21DRAFT_1522706 [Imleria badia]